MNLTASLLSLPSAKMEIMASTYDASLCPPFLASQSLFNASAGQLFKKNQSSQLCTKLLYCQQSCTDS
uniref:Putative ovule protein n=1 Tax=Solanum chacoense TaxID=4108 RepID=A0A0V0H8D1_SOLCH